MATEYTYYKLYNKNGDCDEIYIGKTKDMKQRKSFHIRSCEEFSKIQPVHLFIMANGGIENWDMEVIKKISCDDHLQSLKYEKDILNEFKNEGEKLLNANEPFLTVEEKKEKKIMYSLNHYYNYKMKNRNDQKKYREKNKDMLRKKNQEYTKKNKEKISEKRKNAPKVYCECCKIHLNRSSVKGHLKSAKHYFSSECRIDGDELKILNLKEEIAKTLQ